MTLDRTLSGCHNGIRRRRAGDPQGPRSAGIHGRRFRGRTLRGSSSPEVRNRASRLRGYWTQLQPRTRGDRNRRSHDDGEKGVSGSSSRRAPEHQESTFASSSTPDTGLTGGGGSCIRAPASLPVHLSAIGHRRCPPSHTVAVAPGGLLQAFNTFFRIYLRLAPRSPATAGGRRLPGNVIATGSIRGACRSGC